jgi:hypothetical protein
VCGEEQLLGYIPLGFIHAVVVKAQLQRELMPKFLPHSQILLHLLWAYAC